MSKKIIVAGIGTDTGKTVASAILCKALKALYWKPIQAGDLDNSDSSKIKNWYPGAMIWPETYTLSKPMSPHAAARIDKITVDEKKLVVPRTDENLIIELAGGLMVPLRDDYLNIDWVEKTKLPVVLVSNYYLGSINHTLLTINLLEQRKIPVLGIIFNGKKRNSTFDVIMKRSKFKCLLEINKEQAINPEIIAKYAAKFQL